LDSGTLAKVLNGQTAKKSFRFGNRVPMRPSIASMTSPDTLLKPKEATPIEQSDGKPPAGHSNHLTNSSQFLRDKTQRSKGDDQVEACALEWERSSVGNCVGRSVRTSTTSVLQPLRVDVYSDDLTAYSVCQRTSEESSTTADIEKRLSRTRQQRSKEQVNLASPDPPATWSLIPAIILLSIYYAAHKST
jgi:hypothetical protein